MDDQGDKLLTVTEVAELMGIPITTLYGWRYRGEGPKGYKLGRHVRYRRAEVLAWIEAHADAWAA